MVESSTISLTPFEPTEIATVTIAKYGYLATAPLFPSQAISFRALEAYRVLHGACPRLSIQAFCQGLSGLRLEPYRHVLAEQFSSAFDVYNDILHYVDQLVAAALRRNTPNWRMLNACAACLYRLEGEKPLKPGLLASMDGNSSLKLVDDAFRSGQTRPDERTWRTDLFITAEEVDQFKDEVHNAQKEVDGEDEEREVISEDTLPIEEPAESKSVCAERWRNAGPEARKKMFALFATTGIFACLCRHGQVLVLCDMICSGELMKYPLAIVNRVIDVYGPELSVALGYDIACEFSKTLGHSSLGPRAEGVVSGVVPAFHGHSHNRRCQLDWHPMYLEGVGKEDFEGCERFFSHSNGLASATRLSTAFHRHQAIEGLVARWALLKHAESGRFIFNNYRQALTIINEGTRALDIYARELKTTPEDYKRYLVEEREYLRGLMAEPADIKDRAAVEDYKTLDYQIVHDGITGREISRIQREYLAAQTRLESAEEVVRRLEDMLDIDSRWMPGTPEYIKMMVALGQRRYRRALDNLERLVVQRLFELSKLGMNGLGYKLREKIGHALKARAEAIRKALAEYNRHAKALIPPRPELSWTEVMEMASIGEFDLLRDARQDIREKPWANRSHRAATATYFNVKRAREEIDRLNVEIPRLFTAMIDDHIDHHDAIQAAADKEPALAHELKLRQQYNDAVNAKNVAWLQKASKLHGFTGRIEYGKRIGHNASRSDALPLPSWATYAGSGDGGNGSADDDDDDDDDDIQGTGSTTDATRLVNFIDGLGKDMD
ncbi:hypothetical protein K466DRAFT_505958 [Polyporus arcularius HHB13444]|uniref:CxC1-like cysteine cluster associated with KDZ transposases domain-containing protein n=1 Tax=Polyporus arcularius HHB13444 TaxID=1314778 RepID=A0A5C3NS34_9APHY|nr:hypothetical protein K466DRAFT_505958 [Polyporus arcularius HHB13444]